MHASTSTARRWAALLVPLLALCALVLIGRRATNAAPIAPSTSASLSDAGAPADAPAADASPSTADAPAAPPTSAVEQLADGGFVVDLNRATETDLGRLPGVGPARARKILELRARLGRFKSVDDLARIKGFGRATLKRMRPYARAGA